MPARSSGNREVDIAVEALRKDIDQQFRETENSIGVVFGALDTGTGTNDRYMLPFSPRVATSASEVYFPVYRAGVLSPFMVRIDSIGAAAATRRIEIVLRVNGKDTPMRVHFSCPLFTGILRATQKVKVEKNDLLSVAIRKSAILVTACDLGPLFMELS